MGKSFSKLLTSTSNLVTVVRMPSDDTYKRVAITQRGYAQLTAFRTKLMRGGLDGVPKEFLPPDMAANGRITLAAAVEIALMMAEKVNGAP